MTFHNASNPPSDSRTVVCLMANGQRVLGQYDQQLGFVREPHDWVTGRTQMLNPVGWREIDEQGADLSRSPRGR